MHDVTVAIQSVSEEVCEITHNLIKVDGGKQ